MRYICIYQGATIQDILDHEMMKFIRWFATITTLLITTVVHIFTIEEEVIYDFLMNEKYWRYDMN